MEVIDLLASFYLQTKTVPDYIHVSDQDEDREGMLPSTEDRRNDQ